MKVNYKSDFELTIQLTAGGVDVAAPSWDWQLRFYTCDRQAVYTVAYIDGKAERCAVNTDGTITAYFDKHGLMPGALLCEFVNLVPDSHYTHDTQVQVDPVELGVELWRGASDGGMDAVTLELAGQVLAEVQALAADLQQKAESGYFDGEPGPQGPQGPPGPAGPGLLVVTVTGSDQEALTADHTAAEILAAHDAGRPVVVVYGGEVYQLASVGASLASFSLASADLEVLAQIDVDADGGASRIFDEVQGVLTAGDGINIDGVTISAPRAVPFVVTLTPSGESDVFTPDCTYADAVAADKAGRRVVFKITEEGVVISIDAQVLYISGDAPLVIFASYVLEPHITSFYWTYDKAAAVWRITTEIQPALTFDNAPTAGSSNPVKSGGVFTALQSKADTSTTYTKTEVNTALAGKQDVLTFDNVPTQSSNNPVESGGVFTALQGKQNVLTAGDGINIDGNVISATGGGGSGIESIEQTVTSDESGGINVVTITISDGTTTDFEVMNGKKGDKGDSGVHLGDVVLVNNLTEGGEESALSAEMGKVLNDKIDLLPTPNKNLNKRLFGTIGTSAGVFAKYIDIPRNLFNKYLYFWFTSGDYARISGWSGGVTNGVVTRIDNEKFNSTLKLWDGNNTYRIQRVDVTGFDGYDYIRISLYQKDDDFINALFIGSDLDADYLSWEFVKLRQIPPVTSNWYSGDSEEIKAVTGTKVRPSSVDYTRISTKNLFNPYEIVFRNQTYGAPYYPEYESGFIPVEENTLYTASLKVQGTAVNTSFYNANKERIGTTNFARHTTPTGCAYIKFKLNSYNSGLENLEPDAGVQYEKGEKSYYEPYYLYDAKGMVSALAGKSFAFIGDSFTAPATWCIKMCEILSATSSKNAAVSGGAWHGDDNLSAYSQAQALVTYYNTIPSNQTTAPVKPDYILCVLGVNDVNNNATMGDVSYTDTIGTGGIDPSTFTGGAQATLKTLIDNFPDSIIKIGFTPGGMQYLGATDAMMERLSPYIERLKFLANLYGVSYIETRATGMCRIVASEYEAYRKSAQDSHPNEAGQNRIGEYMARIMLSNM